MGQVLNRQTIRQRYGIYTAPLFLLCNTTKPSLILNISIYRKKDKEYKDYFRIKKISNSLDMIKILQNKFKN